MENEILPRGFKRLSDRYPSFQILYANGISLKQIDQRSWLVWGPLQWLREQIYEAWGEAAPAWIPVPSKWKITLVDGRRFPLTDEEKAQYLKHLEIHETTLVVMNGIMITQNAYKKGE